MTSIQDAVSKRDERGHLSESYISHVEIFEENNRQALNEPTHSNKERFIALVAGTPKGTVYLKKGRKTAEGNHQVGRTWNLNQLGSIESIGAYGLVALIGKEYYWRFKSASDKREFCANIDTVYFESHQRVIPSRLGFDDPKWKGIFDKSEIGRLSQEKRKLEQEKQKAEAEKNSPRMQSIDTWTNATVSDSRYGPGRQSNVDLTRRPSRGRLNAPKTQSPEISQVPKMPNVPQMPRQKLPPHHGQQQAHQHTGYQQPHQQANEQVHQQKQPLNSKTSQGSLRTQQTRGGFQQPPILAPQPQQQQRSHAVPPLPLNQSKNASSAMRPYPLSPTMAAPSQMPSMPLPQNRRQESHETRHQQPREATKEVPRNAALQGPELRRPEEQPLANAHSERRESQDGQEAARKKSFPEVEKTSSRDVPYGSRKMSQDQAMERSKRESQHSLHNMRVPAEREVPVDAGPTSGHDNPHAGGNPFASSALQAAAVMTVAPLVPTQHSVIRPASPEPEQAPVLPVQSPARSYKSHRTKQSDASDASFKSARDDLSIHSMAINQATMHQPLSQLDQSFTHTAQTDERPTSFQSEKNAPFVPPSRRQSKDTTFSPESQLKLKKIYRLSPARFEMRSPRRSRQSAATHTRNGSNVSASSARSQIADEEEYHDLNNVLTQLQFSGNEGSTELEKKITNRITQINDTQVSSVVSLDDKLDELDMLLESSIDECKTLTNNFASIAVQLSTIGSQISSIEGKSEGSQVLEMNKRMLVSELERLLETVHLPKNVTNVLMRTNFSAEELPAVEESLAELYRAYEVLNSSTTTMNVAQEQADNISTTTESFDREFAAYMKKRLHNILTTSEAARGLGRIDTEILQELYPYNGVVLFVKETNSSVYKKLVAYYEDNMKQHMEESLPPYIITWKRKLEATTGKSPEFSFKTGKPGKATVADDVNLKRGKSIKVGAVGLNKHEPKYQHKVLPARGLDEVKLATINSQFDEFVNTFFQQIAAQQQVLVNLFFLSSSAGRKFDVYIHRVPLRLRRETASQFGGPPHILEADSSRKTAQDLHKLLAKIFTVADSQMPLIADTVYKSCVLESVYLIGILEVKLDSLSTTDQEFAKVSLARFRELLVPQWRKFVEDQSRLILESHINMSKRVGILPVAESFVTFVTTVEASMHSLNEVATKTRKLVDDAYNQIFRAITQIFERSSQQGIHTSSTAALSMGAGSSEDKEALNYHVTMIENLYVITQGLTRCQGAETTESIISQTRTLYRKELEAYIADIEQRPLGRILEFVPKSSGASPKFKASTFKKVVSNYDAKELRKNVEVLRKRVQKHFGDEVADSVLVGKVWNAISAEFESKFGKIINLAKQNDAEGLLPLTKQEVRDAMQSFA